jgi:hypothetical protein
VGCHGLSVSLTKLGFVPESTDLHQTSIATRPLLDRPWGVGAATGVGSLPGSDPDEAMRIVVGELESFPHLVELPNAGPSSGMIGRGAALLVDLHTELAVSGWRFCARAGADERRARAAAARGLDVFEEHLQEFSGPAKLQCAGPWSLAASIELRYGDKALADPGAVRDISAALAEGVAGLVADVRRRLPRAQVVMQIDEPLLPAVLTGTVPTASGFSMLRAVEFPHAVEKLRQVVAAVANAGAIPIAHCCAASVPVALLVEAGMRAISFDARVLDEAGSALDDALGEAVEAGVALFMGLVPSIEPDDAKPLRAQEIAAPALRLWSRLGFPPEDLAAHVVVTPSCGLAGASAMWPVRAYRLCVDVARVLVEEPEGAR